MNERTIPMFALITITLLVLTPTLAHGENPARGNYVPADLGTQIHPFIEQFKFGSHFSSGTLLKESKEGWTIKTTINGNTVKKTIPEEHISIPLNDLAVGQYVLLKWDPDKSDEKILMVDYDRRYKYALIIIGSLLLCALVGGWVTIRSMSGVIAGLLFFMYWAIPAIQSGGWVILHIGLFYVLVTLLVLPSSLGWNRKAISAVLTALVTGLISVVILELCAGWMDIVGLRNESLRVVEYATRYFPGQINKINLSDMIVGATLIGSLGVILDVSVDVTSSAAEITSARPDLPFTDVLERAITVSSRLVGTMTNTLLLAYVGTDLFLILTVYILPNPTWITLNQDFVAMEILRGLGGALGFLAAIPLAVVFYYLLFLPESNQQPNAPGE